MKLLRHDCIFLALPLSEFRKIVSAARRCPSSPPSPALQMSPVGHPGAPPLILPQHKLISTHDMKTTTNGQSLLQHRAWGPSRILTSFFGVRRNNRLHLEMIVITKSLAIPSRLPADDKCLLLIRSQIKICERQFSTVRNIGGKKVALINASLPSFQITFASHPALYVQQVTYITSSSSSSSRNTLKWQPDSPFPYSSLEGTEGVGPVKMSEMGA